MRRACVAFRVKLSRDTGTNLTAADCGELLGSKFKIKNGREEVSLQSNPGLFYTCLGAAIMDQRLPFVEPDHEKVAWWCYREAAEVHKHRGGMSKLASCLYCGRGVTEDPRQAVVWFHKAADLGDAASKDTLGAFLLHGDARAGIAQDAPRGFALLREAVELGYGLALYQVARCYVRGEGVEKDAAQGVSLLRQVIMQKGDNKAEAEAALAICYAMGDGVEADTAQAAVWCQKAVTCGNKEAIKNLPLIRRCNFCGTTPARQLCNRCMKVRYCDRQYQLAHWNRETDPHKGPCKEHRRRAAEASQLEAGGASTSLHQ
jgi:TPR repeat protein